MKRLIIGTTFLALITAVSMPAISQAQQQLNSLGIPIEDPSKPAPNRRFSSRQSHRPNSHRLSPKSTGSRRNQRFRHNRNHRFSNRQTAGAGSETAGSAATTKLLGIPVQHPKTMTETASSAIAESDGTTNP